jgi:glycosyltransferase involved in cell wall biosynthesis
MSTPAPKKIVIDAREFRTTTGRYNERLINYLQELDRAHDYTILLSPADYDTWQPTAPNFHKLACPYKEFTFGEQLGFARFLYGLQADLVHFGMIQQPILYRRPSVTTMHDLTTARFTNPDKPPVKFWVMQQVYKMVIRYAARKSKHILVPSEFVKKDVAAYTHANPAKITVTYEAADFIPNTPQTVNGLENKSFVMYIGRPTPHKNLERLIDAFAMLHEKHPDTLLVLAGKLDNNYRRIQQAVYERRRPNIVFTDYITDGQYRWLLETAKAYVFPSLSEGFGLPGLEAMRHGAPVVSSNATCLPEIYKDAALYFDPLDVKDMALKIGQVLGDRRLAADLSAKGRALAATYSWQRMAEQTLSVYTQVLGETPSEEITR